MSRNIEEGNNRFEEDVSTFISIPRLAKRWDTSRSNIYNKVVHGLLPARKLGNRWLILMEFVKCFENGIYQGDLGGDSYGKQ